MSFAYGQPVLAPISLWPTRASGTGATQGIDCAAPPVPVAQPAVRPGTTNTPAVPAEYCPHPVAPPSAAYRAAMPVRLHGRSTRKKKPRGTNPAASIGKTLPCPLCPLLLFENIKLRVIGNIALNQLAQHQTCRQSLTFALRYKHNFQVIGYPASDYRIHLHLL